MELVASLDFPEEKLAGWRERLVLDKTPAQPSRIGKRDEQGMAPLSSTQERLFFRQQMDPESWHYNIPVALWISGRLDEAALEQALREIVRRHEVLRTTFKFTNGELLQHIGDIEQWELRRVDLSGVEETEREEKAQCIVQEEGCTPFDLTAGPLFRARLVVLTGARHVLILNMHHAISDGTSLRIFARELAGLYGSYSRGQASTLPELAIQYGDYAAWQRAHVNGPVVHPQLTYWKKQLADAPALTLPTLKPSSMLCSNAGACHTFEIHGKVAAGLEELGRSAGATLFMTVLAAFNVLLSRYSGQLDITIGTPIAGRTRKEFENLIGCFVNTLVLRNNLGGNPSFRELLKRTRKLALQAYGNQ